MTTRNAAHVAGWRIVNINRPKPAGRILVGLAHVPTSPRRI